MLDALYSKDVLRRAATISRIGRLETPGASVTRVSPVCGSRITVDIKMEEGVVSDYAQDVHACALGQSSAAILAEKIVGKTLDELRETASALRAMLVDGAVPPDGDWSSLGILAPVHDHKTRHGAVMLPFEAAIDAAAVIAGQDGVAPDTQLTRRS